MYRPEAASKRKACTGSREYETQTGMAPDTTQQTSGLLANVSFERRDLGLEGDGSKQTLKEASQTRLAASNKTLPPRRGGHVQ